MAVTVQAADEGDTTTIVETVAEAGERIAETVEKTNSEEAGERVNPEGPSEIVTDKGYHSKKVVSDLAEAGMKTYCSEPQRGPQRWPGQQSSPTPLTGVTVDRTLAMILRSNFLAFSLPFLWTAILMAYSFTWFSSIGSVTLVGAHAMTGIPPSLACSNLLRMSASLGL